MYFFFFTNSSHPFSSQKQVRQASMSSINSRQILRPTLATSFSFSLLFVVFYIQPILPFSIVSKADPLQSTKFPRRRKRWPYQSKIPTRGSSLDNRATEPHKGYFSARNTYLHIAHWFGIRHPKVDYSPRHTTARSGRTGGKPRCNSPSVLGFRNQNWTRTLFGSPKRKFHLRVAFDAMVLSEWTLVHRRKSPYFHCQSSLLLDLLFRVLIISWKLLAKKFRCPLFALLFVESQMILSYVVFYSLLSPINLQIKCKYFNLL